MLAKKGYKLKLGIEAYLELLEKWYKEFHFEESRDFVKSDYLRTKAILQNMIKMY